MNKQYELWRKDTITGCVYEDESDTRERKTIFFLVSEEEKEEASESMADDCGYSDYSYQPNYNKVADLDIDEIFELADVLNKFKQETESKKMLGEIEE